MTSDISSAPPRQTEPTMLLEARLLIVDDNPKIHEDFRKVLAGPSSAAALDAAEAALLGDNEVPVVSNARRFEIDSAFQGEEAVGLVRTIAGRGACYAAAFVDIRMPPGWDGLRTARELWAVDPGLQIVFCTAYSDYTWEDMLEQVGSSHDFLVLKKPFDAIEVRQIAQALTEKRRLLQENQAHLFALEEKVKTRTAQLERANTQLHQEMTERVVLERGLRQAQKLEALGRLVASVGHEINNPLAFVLSNLEYAISELQQVNEQSQDPRLATLCDVLAEAALGAERIKKIIHGVRLYSRPWEASPAEMDLHETLRAALVIVSNELRHRAEVAEQFGDIPHVIGDPNRLEQVFVNLLLNASHAIPNTPGTEGRIRISTARRGDDEVVIEIADNGVGIPKDELERVFEPFYSTRPVGTGTGLGLWVCRCIVDNLGGHIRLDSVEGEGTVATVVLRRTMSAKEKAESLHPSRRAAPLPQRASLLLVDDEPSLLRALKRTLRDHTTVICRDGREALDLYEAHPFDLVLCDMMMPRMSGMDFYHALAEKGVAHTQRIIFMTGGVLTEPIREFLADVPNPWLGKPFATNDLLDTIARQLALVRGESAS